MNQLSQTALKGEKVRVDLETKELLLREKELRCKDIGLLNSAMHKVVFVLIAAVGSGLSLMAKGEWILRNDMGKIVDNIGPELEFAVSQFAILLAWFAISLLINMNLQAAYIAAIEERLNEEHGIKVSVWESVITRNYLWKPSSASWKANIVIASFGAVIIARAGYVAFTEISRWICLLLIIETLVLLVLVACMQSEHDVVRHEAYGELTQIVNKPAKPIR